MCVGWGGKEGSVTQLGVPVGVRISANVQVAEHHFMSISPIFFYP